MTRGKIAALFVLLIYIFSATATVELLKLPVLAEHFLDHKDENNDTGMITFLVQHYIYEDGTDRDAEEDSQLPFKSGDQLTTLAFNCLAPPSFIQLPADAYTGADTRFFICNLGFYTPGHLTAIWQPPRNC